jgi:hypothetical protein
LLRVEDRATRVATGHDDVATISPAGRAYTWEALRIASLLDETRTAGCTVPTQKAPAPYANLTNLFRRGIGGSFLLGKLGLFSVGIEEVADLPENPAERRERDNIHSQTFGDVG